MIIDILVIFYLALLAVMFGSLIFTILNQKN